MRVSEDTWGTAAETAASCLEHGFGLCRDGIKVNKALTTSCGVFLPDVSNPKLGVVARTLFVWMYHDARTHRKLRSLRRASSDPRFPFCHECHPLLPS